MTIHIAPTDKHHALDDFKAVEELLYDIDRLSNIRHCRTVAHSTKGFRSTPNPHVAYALQAQ
jgi:hypothetical protein